MSKRHLIAVAVLALLVPSLVMGQNKAAQPADDDSASNGRVWGNYTVRQSIEFGGRITENSGNAQMYDTLVNLQSGPRLLGQELSMQSNKREGSLFDNLYLSSFGLGGDPNDMVRLRVEKNKLYNFVGLYRRDQNFFDYNLFANPLTLNPGITNCSTVVASAVSPCAISFNPKANSFYTNSPHFQDTTRNMGDFNLTLFPQSAVRVRLGFARTNNSGTIDSTQEDVNVDLTQQTHQRSDRWSFGVDVRPLARTTLSFDQFFEHDKVDTAYVNNPLNPYTVLIGGVATPVSIPITFPTCTVTVAGKPQPYITAAGVLNPLCNTGIFSYSRNENIRSNFPTTQLSLRSNYFRKLDITASGSYSSGDSKLLNFDELFHGLVSRTNNTAYNITGPAATDRVSGNVDLGLTYHLTKSWSVSDQFRWLDWRDPGAATELTSTCYSNLASGANIATPTGAPCALATLLGITTVGNATPTTQAASATAIYSTLEAERIYSNKATLNWAPSRRLSAYLGYRYQRRELTTADGITGTSTTLANVTTATTPTPYVLVASKTNENSAIGGVVLRPTDKWRINADTELMYADNTFTYTGPRHEQRVRASTVYKLNRWASINGSMRIVESRNNFAADINNSGLNLFSTSGAGTVASPYIATTNSPAYGNKNHQRYYSLGASLNPIQKVSFDFGWTYMDQMINSATCMPIAANVVTPAFAASNMCPGVAAGTSSTSVTAGTAASPILPVVQAYQENTNTAYAILTFRPVHRVALNLGYEITSTSGYDNWLRADTGAPLGVLGDSFGNVPGIPGNLGTSVTGATTSVGTNAFFGPFPNQPQGPQNFNWTKITAGMAVNVCKGLTFKGNYAYYDYTEKEGNIPVAQLVALPRNFHTNVGTVSLKYSF